MPSTIWISEESLLLEMLNCVTTSAYELFCLSDKPEHISLTSGESGSQETGMRLMRYVQQLPLGAGLYDSYRSIPAELSTVLSA